MAIFIFCVLGFILFTIMVCAPIDIDPLDWRPLNRDDAVGVTIIIALTTVGFGTFTGCSAATNLFFNSTMAVVTGFVFFCVYFAIGMLFCHFRNAMPKTVS